VLNVLAKRLEGEVRTHAQRLASAALPPEANADEPETTLSRYADRFLTDNTTKVPHG
jgi:hypothetical protein